MAIYPYSVLNRAAMESMGLGYQDATKIGGTHALWVDSDGNLRSINGVPNSQTDGGIVSAKDRNHPGGATVDVQGATLVRISSAGAVITNIVNGPPYHPFVLLFTANKTINPTATGSNLRMAYGQTTFIADDTLTLLQDGDTIYEIGRSRNDNTGAWNP